MLDATVASEKRRSYRYDAVQTSVYLGWWEEAGFRTLPAELKNLSYGGAMLVSPEAPPEGERTWLCVSGIGGDWAEVVVVASAGHSPGVFEVRVRFVEMCPYEMFTLAVHGITAGV